MKTTQGITYNLVTIFVSIIMMIWIHEQYPSQYGLYFDCSILMKNKIMIAVVIAHICNKSDYKKSIVYTNIGIAIITQKKEVETSFPSTINISIGLEKVALSSYIFRKQALRDTLQKIPKFHLTFWCVIFVEKHSLRIVSSKSPETMRKLHLST